MPPPEELVVVKLLAQAGLVLSLFWDFSSSYSSHPTAGFVTRNTWELGIAPVGIARLVIFLVL